MGNKIKSIFLAVFAIILMTGCGQGSSFSSTIANKNTGSSMGVDSMDEISEDQLIDMVDKEQILLVDENDIVNDPTDEVNQPSAGTPGTGGMPGMGSLPGGIPGMGSIPGLDGILGGVPGGETGDGNGCGNRDAHTLKIQGPNGTYIGLGGGTVEVSTPQAYVCVSPNEVLVGIGDVNENLQDAASCSESQSEDKIYVCHKTADGQGAVESCISKEKLYVHINKQETGDKTYLGRCL